MRLRRKGDDEAVRLVLVATDRSETAERAVRFAAEMADRYEAELLVVRVLVDFAGDLGMTQNGCEELGSDIGAEQLFPVLRERRMIPNGVINAEADEPAEQQILVDFFSIS